MIMMDSFFILFLRLFVGLVFLIEIGYQFHVCSLVDCQFYLGFDSFEGYRRVVVLQVVLEGWLPVKPLA